MKKYTILLVLSLAAGKSFAADLQTQQSRLNQATATRKNHEDQINNLDSQIKAETDKLSQTHGKAEYMDEHKNCCAKLKALIEQKNGAVDRYKGSYSAINEAVGTAGTSYAVDYENGRGVVKAPVYQKLAPIVHPKPTDAGVVRPVAARKTTTVVGPRGALRTTRTGVLRQTY